MRSSTSTVRGRKSTSRRPPATAVQRTIVSPWRTTTAPEACLAILPVSNEISLPAISTETRVTASLLIFTAFLFRPSVGGPFSFSLYPNAAQLSGPAAGAVPEPRLAPAARGPRGPRLEPLERSPAAALRAAAAPRRRARRRCAAARGSAARPARPPGSSSGRRRRASMMTSARCGKPPGCRTPKRLQAAPLGSKSESCSLLTPSFSRNAACDQVASQETPYRRAAPLGELADQRLVELELVGADRAERERVEDEDRAAGRAGPPR